MSSKTNDIIEYVVVIISCFAKRFSLSNADAYAYMKTHMGLDYLIKDYDGIHTQSVDDAVDFAATICRRFGGTLA